MQSMCSLQLGPPCAPSASLGSQSSSASFQLEEKQLFEKFWKGTFKAVATPRMESVIVASITASRRLTDSSETTTCRPIKTDEGKVVDLQVDSVDRNGCSKGRKYHSHRRAKRPCDDEERPKGRKKKRKAERKRKRKRSPSYSLSPPRKKKKKKKKNSKKSRRHRYTSKKSKHRSSTLKRKRKDDRKHKKSSRNHSHRRRRCRRSESDFDSCLSSPEDRHHLQKSVVRQTLGHLAAGVEATDAALNHADTRWRPTTKSVCKTAPKSRSILSSGTVLSSKTGGPILHRNSLTNVTSQAEGQHDYDSGNDTSSPPSSKTGISRASVTDGKKNATQVLASPEKLKLADRDIASDSGNSVSSYTSLCKPYEEDGLAATLFSRNGKREPITLGCRLGVERSPKTSSCSQRRREQPRKRQKSRPSISSSSRSRSRSSGSSRNSGRDSRSPSLSSCSTYSRSPSSSADLRRRGSTGSLSSRGSYPRHRNNRQRNRKGAASSRDGDSKHKYKVSKKRRGRKSYSPMRKRRRDSPSHLEARRITSARKRPIPYFRPSPSSSSRCSSVSTWSSLFTRNRSPIYSVSRSRSRSPSYSSYWSYSRSSSWDSRDRSRSRSRSALKRRKKTRR